MILVLTLVPVVAVLYSVGLLLAIGRHPDDDCAPHAALTAVPNVLSAVFILLSSFEVVTGWANRTAAQPIKPPGIVFAVDVLAAGVLLAYPALAGLPNTRRHQILLGLFALPVGAILSLAWYLQN
ncbi:hypothetical protein BJP40_25740 [Streptomyces sp. CC53]|uniref:hypothetical protein n=1 Tax=unclassified Streptomyces TaxID=2593676 RepID=UPI0008DD4C4D|nr:MULTISPECIES: hypothetical protein [unclassified Streptomyces]OII63054.1 hypothetical protein BJP40_25740 [Streptomyces sp. CC53]